MTTTSMQFGQSTIDVVLNEGQFPAKTTTSSSGGVEILRPDVGAFVNGDLGHPNGLRHTDKHMLMAGEVMDFPTPTFVAVGSGSGSIDTSARNVYGGYTATLNVGTTANNYTRIRTYTLPSLANLDLDGSPFVVVVEVVSGMQDADQITLVFATDPATNGASVTWSLRTAYHIGNLYFFVAPASSLALSGGLAWTTAMTYMHVEAKCLGTTGGTIKVHGVFRRMKARPKLIIDFDDAWDSLYYQAYPYMAKYGLVGNVGVIADRVGTAGYCTEAQLDEMYAAGWDMTVHGDTGHGQFGMTTYAQISADVSHNQSYVSARWPRAAYHYIFPTGTIDQSYSELALTDLGFKTSRVTVYASIGQALTPWGVDSPLSMIGRSINDNNKAVLLTDLDSAIESRATCRQFGHRIQAATVADATIDILNSDWRTTVDGYATRVAAGKVDCVTISQWAEWMGL